jgi:VCBS repeat-containing protein
LSATDVDNPSLIYSVVTQPANGSVVLGVNGSYTYTPAANFNGSDSFTFKANDGSADSNIATVSVTIAAVNDAPTGPNYLETILEDQGFSAYFPWIKDPEGDPVTYAIHTPAKNGISLMNADSFHTYIPNQDFFGVDDFLFVVSDPQGAKTVFSARIIVTPVNDPPVASNSALSITEDAPFSGLLIATDVDNSSVTYAVVSKPANGSVMLGANGAYSYTPVANFSGSDSFTFKANDGSADSNTASVTITVAAVNDAPVLATPLVDRLVTLGTSLNFTLGSAAFADVDSPSLTYTAARSDGSALPAWLSFNASTRTFSGTPASSDLGTVSVKVTASDGSLSASDVFDILVNQRPNTAPVAANATGNTNEDTALTASLPTSTDGERDPVTYAKATNPSHGTASVTSGGNYTYTPATNYNGSDSFAYTVSDGQGGSNTYTVNLTISAVNDSPVANNGTLSIAEDAPFGGAVIATDVDSANLTFAVVSQPANGRVVLGANGFYTYSPAPNFNGSDSFTFKANDGSADSNIAKVTIAVAAVNDAPLVATPLADRSVTLGSSLNFTVGSADFADVDSASLTYTATRADGSALPAWLSFNSGTRTFSGTPASGDLGTVSVKVTASDGSSSTSDVFDMTVTEPPRAVSGVVQDGYVAGASIFVDRNGNGLPDAGEDTGLRTDSSGNFTGTISGTGNLIAVGGTNIDTGLRNTLTLTAPQGATVISPVTTLVQTLVSTQALTPTQAQQKVAQAFGIDSATDLLRFDPLASTGSATSATALAVQKANAQVALTAGLVENTTSVISGLAQVVAQASTPVDLSKATTLAQVTSGLNVSDTLQTTIAQGNAQVQSSTSLNSVAQAQKTAVTTALPPNTDWTAPAVSSFSPADGAAGLAVSSNLTLTFSEPVQRGSGSITLRRADGAVVEQFDAATSSRLTLQGNILTLDPSTDLTAATGYYLEMLPGSVKDSAGNLFVGTSTYDFSTSATRTATSTQPLATVSSTADAGQVVVKIEPGAWSTGSNGLSMSVSYDAGLYSLSNYGLIGFGSSASSGSISEAGNLGSAALTLSLSNGLTSGGMQLVFTAKSSSAVTFSASLSNVVINSTAGALTVPSLSLDTQGPQATKWGPVEGAKAVPVGSNLTVTFNELIQAGTGPITLKTADGKVVETFTAANTTVSGSTLTLNPTSDLSIFTKYVVELGAGAVRDMAGNGNAADTSYDFLSATVDNLYHFCVVAFGGAPGAIYMRDLAEAWNYGSTLQQIIDTFTAHPLFLTQYPRNLNNLELATKFVENTVKSSATAAVKAEGIQNIKEALDFGLSVGEVLYETFSKFTTQTQTDPVWTAKWGNLAKQFQNQLAVSRYLTEVLEIQTIDVPWLRSAISNVTHETDVSSPELIVQIIGTPPSGG